DAGPHVVRERVARDRDVARLLDPHAVAAAHPAVRLLEGGVVDGGVAGDGVVRAVDVEPDPVPCVVVDVVVAHGQVGGGTELRPSSFVVAVERHRAVVVHLVVGEEPTDGRSAGPLQTVVVDVAVLQGRAVLLTGASQ